MYLFLVFSHTKCCLASLRCIWILLSYLHRSSIRGPYAQHGVSISCHISMWLQQLGLTRAAVYEEGGRLLLKANGNLVPAQVH